MNIGHIFRGHGGKWELWRSAGASMIGATLVGSYAGKWEAKMAAKELGLRGHNY